MRTVLELRSVTRVHGSGHLRVEALSGISLQASSGELLAVMGPSGSGKTTLLSLGGGLDQPTEGTVLVQGVDLSLLSAAELARLRRNRIGYVFQQFNLIDGLTAAENVSLPLELDGIDRRRARRRALQSLDLMGMVDLADRFPDELSGGEQQRVAIARAVIGDRILLLADEPTGALDSVTGEAVLRLMREHCDRGGCGLLVTHDARFAAWADRIVFLRDGRVIDQTDAPAGPESLLNDPVAP
jgi:putative ABC transport system ATP-binding protein